MGGTYSFDELDTGRTTRASVGTGGVETGPAGRWVDHPADISPNGRYVAFESRADNVVANDTNGKADVFVRDRQTDRTIRVSKAEDGTEGDGHCEGPEISADAEYVVFTSYGSNLVPGDTNDETDVFLVHGWKSSPYDFNNDTAFNTEDVTIFMDAWNQAQEPDGGLDPRCDIAAYDGDILNIRPDPDGVIDTRDAILFIDLWLHQR